MRQQIVVGMLGSGFIGEFHTFLDAAYRSMGGGRCEGVAQAAEVLAA